MTAATNLLAFTGLVVTLAIVWRQSWPGRLRLFALQSLLLAALAATLGVLAGRPRLLLLALVFLVVKVVVIPRVLRRIGSGMPVRPVAPGNPPESRSWSPVGSSSWRTWSCCR
jgi:hydrogenase-4 membrane subunit HyfE